jgi:hypothetical protein
LLVLADGVAKFVSRKCVPTFDLQLKLPDSAKELAAKAHHVKGAAHNMEDFETPAFPTKSTPVLFFEIFWWDSLTAELKGKKTPADCSRNLASGSFTSISHPSPYTHQILHHG